MSAIAALFARDGGEADGGIVGQMLARLAHRAPDGAFVHRAGEAALGHGALVTCRADAAPQPLASDDGMLVLAADARLDNRDELAAVLRSELREGVGDAALLLAGYRRWGERVVGRLLGDFAFVLWDARRRRLLLARDPLGARMLYYHADAHAFRCASEPSALCADPRVARTPNLEAVAQFITWDYGDNDETLLTGVRALPAAHVALVSARELRLERYWSPDPWRKLEGSADEQAERLLATLRDAVRARLCSDGPIAATVSGGMDSTTVAALAEEQRRNGTGPREPVTAVELAFDSLPCDERFFAHQVARRWELPELACAPLDRADLSRPVADARCPDLTFNPQHTMWLTMLEPLAQRGVRVLLTGEWSDFWIGATGLEWVDALRRGRVGHVAREAGLSRPWQLAPWRALWLECFRYLVPEPVRARLPRPGRRAIPQLLTPRAREIVWQCREKRRLAARAGDFPDEGTRAMCKQLDGPTHTALLGRYDRLAASRGLEARHPFLDQRVFELVLGVAPELRHERNGSPKPKPLLRRAMRGILPDEVVARTDSTHFTCYVDEVLYQQQAEPIRRLFATSRLVEAGILEPDAARAMAQGTLRPRWDRAVGMVAMEIFLRA